MLIENKKWQLLSTSYALNEKWIKVRKDVVKLPSGDVLDDFYVLEYSDWINVIAITEDNKFVIERQYRHAYGQMCMEICAGVVEKDETPLEAAKRELREETGYGGGDWSVFMKTTANPAIMNNTNYCFIAKGVKRITEIQQEKTEDIEVFILHEQDVLEHLLAGDFTQSLMCAPLWQYFYEKNNNVRNKK